MPSHERGFYVVVASMNPNFETHKNIKSGIYTTISDLVLSSRLLLPSGKLEVRVQNGISGMPMSQVKVTLMRLDYQKGHQKEATLVTNSEGEGVFENPKTNSGSNYLLFAENNENFAFTSSDIYFYNNRSENATSYPIFIYTDRSIYRPEQKIQFKVLAYEGKANEGHFSSIKEASIKMELRDANNELIKALTVKTDQFGAGFGEFEIPRGKLLGHWTLIANGWNNAHSIQVEEYKRPTFEVKMHDSKKANLLNQEVQFLGDARYYFGMPLTGGKIKFRIYRSGVLPWWSFWCRWDWGFYSREQLVENGVVELKKDGEFAIKFKPKADESLAKNSDGKVNQDLVYNYRVEVDVTDEGGETRTANRTYQIGFVSVKAQLLLDQGFVREAQDFTFQLLRTDLSGAARSGEGSWILYALKDPEKVLLPSEMRTPSEFMKFYQGIRIDGDGETPRFASRYDWEMYVRSWPEGPKVAEGKTLAFGSASMTAAGASAATAATATTTQKEILLKAQLNLKPGIYRLVYKTKDDFGSEIVAQKHVLIASPKAQFKVPLFMALEKNSVSVNEKARLFVTSGFKDQKYLFERYHSSRVREKKYFQGSELLEFEVQEADRGGAGFQVDFLRHYESLILNQALFVPWDNKDLSLEWSTFRDKLRPGQEEVWDLKIKAPEKMKGTSTKTASSTSADKSPMVAQVLAYMYDRSLDFFAPHSPTNPKNVYPTLTGTNPWNVRLGAAQNAYIDHSYGSPNEFSGFSQDYVHFEYSYGVGGPGARGGFGSGGGGMLRSKSMHGEISPMAVGGMAVDALSDSGSVVAAPAPRKMEIAKDQSASSQNKVGEAREELQKKNKPGSPAESDGNGKAGGGEDRVRTEFQETAFWLPKLQTDDKGIVHARFTVPDSLTSWNVWALAITKDLKSGLIQKTSETIKELMVRPYLPRFFREGDQVEVKIVVSNSSEIAVSGNLEFSILNPETKKSLAAEFKLKLSSSAFKIPAKGTMNVTASLSVPMRLGSVLVEVKAKSTNGFSDGERRPIVLIPGRIHLAQSRFKVLKDKSVKELKFQDLIDNKDSSIIHEQMVVTLDAQLFYSVLSALPYLVNDPYECIEQTLNKFVSTGILTSLFNQFPSVAKMAKEFSARKTPLEAFDAKDPNRKVALEETPWLQESRGHLPGSDGTDPNLLAVLDPHIAKSTRELALKDLEKAQTSLGAFPWFPGGPPSPYITLYVLYGLSKAIEFGVDVPKPLVQRAWSYMKQHYIQEMVKSAYAHDCCWEEITFLNYVLSNYKDQSWGNDVFTDEDRQTMLNFSFKHWKTHSPYLKGYLSLTLQRMKRAEDSKLVWASVMDSAKSSEDEGTHWAAEDRSWLWYNDTIETHAFALRTGMEVGAKQDLLDGMVLWLFLNKKLNHWKSTRATAEVIYSLAHYLKKQGSLGVKEEAKVSVGSLTKKFEFLPDHYTGKKNQLEIPGSQVGAELAGKSTGVVRVEKSTPGYLFASATWHFSTLEMPKESRGDFLQIDRAYFKREVKNGEMVIKSIKDLNESLKVGDEVEVQISVRAKHELEYVHLRDPRPAGFEPVTQVSSHKWDLGIYWYEEVRDTGTNFFFEHLPHGQYNFKYRLRATNGGVFTAAPATITPMYAPEFTAYSAGGRMKILDL